MDSTLKLPRKVLVAGGGVSGRGCAAILAELGEPMLSSTLLLPGEEEPLALGWEIKERLGAGAAPVFEEEAR